MEKLTVQATRNASSQIVRWVESIGAENREELAEMIEAALDHWSGLQWSAISDCVERNGGRRSYASYLVVEGSEPRPKPTPLMFESRQLIESGWLSSGDATLMLRSMPHFAEGLRRRRLFACACARHLWSMLSDEWRDALPFAESYADERITQREMLAHVPAAALNRAESVAALAMSTGNQLKLPAFFQVAHHMATALAGGNENPERYAFRAGLASCSDLVRDVFSPFRKRSDDSPCLTPMVKALAGSAYENVLFPSGHLDPDYVTVFADALEETGAAEEMVAHLRTSRPHVRGCHVVDICRRGLK
jgi:hypothetical protein